MQAAVSLEPPPVWGPSPRLPLRASKISRLSNRPQHFRTIGAPDSATTGSSPSSRPVGASQFSSKLPGDPPAPGKGLRLKKYFTGMSAHFSRRWLLTVSILLGVSIATFSNSIRARPLLNVLETDGLSAELEQVHVSLAGQGYVKVTWTTSEASPSVVEYGTSPGKYTSTATGSGDRYRFLLYRSGVIHNAVIGPLLSNVTYYYKCSQTGNEYNFKTPPDVLPLEFAVIGDLGQTDNSENTLKRVQQSNYDVLLYAGDLSYADYEQRRWDSFGRLVQSSASSRPWMVTEGNHEIETLLVSSFKAYNTRWRMPYELSDSPSNLYYSFEVAGSHVVMLGSYADYDVGSKQYEWLQADLAKVDRDKTPWLIVVLHAPWYNSNDGHKGEGDEMMEALEPVLHAARADILFAGHVHAYERWARMYNKTEDPCGTIHITIGDGGNREGLATEWLAQPAGSIFREASYGHGRLRIVNSSHAHWSWHRNADEEGVIGDQIWIKSLSSGCDQTLEPRRSPILV